MVIDIEKYFLRNGLRIPNRTLIKENILKDFPDINNYNEELKLVYNNPIPSLSPEDFRMILQDRCFQALSPEDFKKSTILETKSRSITSSFNAAISSLIVSRKNHEKRLKKIECCIESGKL